MNLTRLNTRSSSQRASCALSLRPLSFVSFGLPCHSGRSLGALVRLSVVGQETW